MAEAAPAASRTIEEERLDLDRRRLALESSFPKKWGSVLFGAMATIMVAVVSGAVSWTTASADREETARQKQAEQEVTMRQEADAQHNHQIENARTALDMYFKYVADGREGDVRSLYDMRMIAEISDSEGVKAIFYEMRDELVDKRRAAEPQTPITDIAATLPSINVDQSGNAVKYQDFTVYIQYPRGSAGLAAAGKVQSALAGLGVRVPGLEGVDAAHTPDASEVRFYSALQKVRLTDLAVTLKQTTGLDFNTKVLPTSGLPGDTFEIWIGKAGG